MALRIGLIGTGGIVKRAHLAALQASASAELWSVLSRDKGRAIDFAKANGASSPNPAHDRLDTLLLDPDLDAVLVATPDKLHCTHAVAAAEAGKHVLLEKLIATSLSDAEAIVEACARNNVRLGLCYHLRWHKGHRDVVTRAHQGDFGSIRHVRTLWTWHAPDDSNWRASEKLGRWWSLAGVGTHCLDLVSWTLSPSSGKLKEFSSTVSKENFGGPHDETAVLSGRYDSGATFEVCSSVLFNSPSRFEIYGTKGFAICEATFGTHGAGRVWTNSAPLEFQVESPFIGLINDFCQAVAEGRDPAVSGEEASSNLVLLLRADP